MIELPLHFSWHVGETYPQMRQIMDVLRPLEAALSAGRFAEVEAWMSGLDLDVLYPAAVVTILGMTKHAAAHMPSRGAFAKRAAEWLEVQVGAERSVELLRDRM